MPTGKRNRSFDSLCSGWDHTGPQLITPESGAWWEQGFRPTPKLYHAFDQASSRMLRAFAFAFST